MRLAIALLLLVFLLGFGCLEQKAFPSSVYEQVTDTQAVDLSGSGIPDYTIYTFAPVTSNESGMTLQRTVSVATESSGVYTTMAQNFSGYSLLLTETSLDEFSNSSNQTEDHCLEALGLQNEVCSDVPTCIRLCSTASPECERIASVYSDVLAGSMIIYVQDVADMRAQLFDAQQIAATLDNATPEDKNAFLGDIYGITGKIAAINANPLYAQPDVTLCSHSDYGVSNLLDAAQEIGRYETTSVDYNYTVLLSAKPLSANSQSISRGTSGIELTDKLPITVIQKPEGITSVQKITTLENGSDIYISWNSTMQSDSGYLFVYEFASTVPPQTVLASLSTPMLTVNSIDLSALSYTVQLFGILNGIVKNYYIALGMALGLTIAVLLLACDAILLVIALIREHTLASSFRKAFGRTSVTWKSNAVLAIIALAAGVYVSIMVASQPPATASLIESLVFMAQNGTGMVGVAFTFIGVLLAYFAVGNIFKIRMLEVAYGIMRQHEKDEFLAQANQLKGRLNELKASLENARQENIDVNQEYEIFSSITQEKIDALAKDMNVQNRVLVGEYGMRVDNAVKSLAEKRKLAEDNWPRWSVGITKLLEGQKEVYAYYLVDVPVSLRMWALERYVKEKGAEGVVLDRDVLKRKKMTVNQIIHDMLEQKMITGAIVMREENVEIAEFADGSSETVRSVLALKLRAYMNSLARNINQRGPVSLLVVGNDIAIVYLRERSMDSFIFIGKDRFTTAMEQWKARTKMLE